MIGFWCESLEIRNAQRAINHDLLAADADSHQQVISA
jgi:hypothetical protein